MVSYLLTDLLTDLLKLGLYATLLAWAASVVRKRRDVFDRFDFEPGCFQGSNGAFATTARPLHADFNFLHAKLLGLVGRLLGSHLAGKRGALAASLETCGASTGPTERVALLVGNGYRRVVERRGDIGDAHGYIATRLSLCLAFCFWLGFTHNCFLTDRNQCFGTNVFGTNVGDVMCCGRVMCVAGEMWTEKKLAQVFHTLFASHCFLGTLTSSGIGFGTLPSDWQTATMTEPTVAADVS